MALTEQAELEPCAIELLSLLSLPLPPSLCVTLSMRRADPSTFFLILLLFTVDVSAGALATDCGMSSVDSNRHERTSMDAPRHCASADLSSHPSPYSLVRGAPYTVSSDERAITINGQRVLLQSGIIHYPRSTPSMWPSLLRNLRLANLNTVQTYVFWNYHELSAGQWDFHSESRNLSHFLALASAEGLFVNLRLGPYVCAEFAHGGLPHYLKAVPGMVFRDYNPAWLNATRYYLEYMRDYLQPYLPKHGGPVILAQVENEYSQSDPPSHYIVWLAALTVELNEAMGIVFYINNQQWAPLSVLAARDSYVPVEVDYINGTARARKQPALVVESYTGWFEPWYNAHSHRPAEDHSMAFGEFVAAGGAYYTYYMYHGGTNFARWGGATPGVMGYIHSYGYAAPLSENGQPNPTKYVNHALLARTLSRYASTIINTDYAWPLPLQNLSSPLPPSPYSERNLYSYTLGTVGVNGSAVFVFNRNVSDAGEVEVGGKRFLIPYWTLFIVDGVTLEVVYDSNTMSDVTYPMPELGDGMQRQLRALSTRPKEVRWQPEVVGITGKPIVSQQPIDQLMAAGYTTSYVLYEVNVSVTDSHLKAGSVQLTLSYVNDFVYVWLDDTFLFSSPLIDRLTNYSINASTLCSGAHRLRFATVMMGVDNYTPDPTKHKGLAGGIVRFGSELLTDGTYVWHQQLGLTGESLHVPDGAGRWQPIPAHSPRWSWYHINISTPHVADRALAAQMAPPTYQLNMTSMAKGWTWVNGHELGLYWLATVDDSAGCQRACNRTGTLGMDDPAPLCRSGCGEYYQKGLYHVPADWLNESGQANAVVVFEEGWDGSKEVNAADISLGFWQSNED